MRRITIDVEIKDGADVERLRDYLFEFFVNDEDEVFPEIEVVYGVEIEDGLRHDDCYAARYQGTPCYQGPHAWHFFTYGPNHEYTGSCRGKEA